MGTKGNPAKIWSGFTALTGDEHHRKPLSNREIEWKGVADRIIRKSENLLVHRSFNPCGYGFALFCLRISKGKSPGSLTEFGDFY